MNDEGILRPAGGITEFRGEYPCIVWLVARQQAENMRLTERVIIEAQSIMVVSFGQHIRIAGLTIIFFGQTFGDAKVQPISISRTGICQEGLVALRAGD